MGLVDELDSFVFTLKGDAMFSDSVTESEALDGDLVFRVNGRRRVRDDGALAYDAGHCKRGPAGGIFFMGVVSFGDVDGAVAK